MILYPTETVYGLGVNALSETELARLFELKQRDERQTVSWLVRDVADIERYAVVGERAAEIMERWLPGPLTLVLQARDEVSRRFTRYDGTIAFRISSDPLTRTIIADYMAVHDAPLTCTSANISGQPPEPTTAKILQQFGAAASKIDKVIDDGPRAGIPSTIVRLVDDELTLIRAGAIDFASL